MTEQDLDKLNLIELLSAKGTETWKIRNYQNDREKRDDGGFVQGFRELDIIPQILPESTKKEQRKLDGFLDVGKELFSLTPDQIITMRKYRNERERSGDGGVRFAERGEYYPYLGLGGRQRSPLEEKYDEERIKEADELFQKHWEKWNLAFERSVERLAETKPEDSIFPSIN